MRTKKALASLFLIVFLGFSLVQAQTITNTNIVTTLSFDIAAYSTEGLNLHLWCPNCRIEWQPRYKPRPSLPNNWDWTQLLTIKCPNCTYVATFYFSLHKAGTNASVCISIQPISAGWWNQNG